MKQQDTVFEVGSHVQIMSYGPFRGLRGTIRTVDMIAPHREEEEPLCFYQITVEGAHVQEPVWFAGDEAELVALPSVVL